MCDLRAHRFALVLIAMLCCGWATGCASSGTEPVDLATTWPRSQIRLDTAPPAARDALKDDLSWIASDAPTTQAQPERTEPGAGGATER